MIDSTGFAGQLGGSVTVSVPGVHLAGTLNLQLNMTNGPVSDTITFGTAPTASQSVVVGDVNGDGKPDVIVAAQHGQLLEYLNNGQLNPFGSVTPIQIAVAGSSGNIATLALAALQSGGPLDLIAANSTGSNAVYLNDGKGNFTRDTQTAASLGSNGTALAVGDLNGDGQPDVVITNGNQVKLYLNAGVSNASWSGFGSTPASIGGSASQVNALALVALTSGGPLDLIVATAGTNGVYVNNGHGSLTLNAASLGSGGTALAVGDLNGDGTPDVVIDNAGSVTEYISTVSGATWQNFGTGQPISAITGATALALAHVTGAGPLDLIVSGATNGVYSNNGTGTFTLDNAISLGSNGSALALGDLNGDGHPDLVLGSASAPIQVGLGTAGGGLAALAPVSQERLIITTAGPFLQLTGTALTLSVLGLQIGGDFTLTESQLNNSPAVSASLANGSLSFAGNSLSGITGNLLLTNGGVAADISMGASLTFGSLPNTVQITGTQIKFELNTSTSPVQLTDEIPAGFAAFTGTGLSITVGGFTVSGGITIETQTDSTGAKKITLGIVGGTVQVNGSTVLSGVQGGLVIQPGSSASLAGQLQGTVNFSSLLPSGMTLSGTAGLVINQTGVEVTESIQIGAQTVSFDLPGTAPGATTAGPYVVLSGTGLELTMPGGLTLSGNFSYVHPTSGDDHLTASNVSFSLGGVVSLANGTGDLTIHKAPENPTGLSGTISGDVSVTIPGVSVSGHIALTLQPGQTPAVQGTGLVITVGGQTIAGDITFTQTAGVTTVAFANVKAYLGTVGSFAGDSAAYATSLCVPGASPASGSFGVSLCSGSGNITVSGGVVSGNVAATAKFVGLPTGITIGGPSGVSVSVAWSPNSLLVTTTAPVTFTVPGVNITGTFTFQRTTSNGTSVVLITASGVGICVGTNNCSGSWVGAQITNGSAAVLITPAGVAGQISGGVAIHLGGTAQISATTATLSFNTGAGAVNQQYTAGGQTQTLSLPTGPFYAVSAQGVHVNLGPLTLSTDLTFQDAQGQLTVTFANAGVTFAAGGANVVVVSHGAGSFGTDSNSTGFYGTLTADVAVNVPGVTVSGTFAVTLNTATTPQTPQGATTAIDPNTIEVTGTNVTLGILGQTLTGSIGFEKTSDGTVVITVSSLTLSLGTASATLLTATINSGVLVVTPHGIAAQVSATVQSGPAISSFVTFNGTFNLSINETNAAVNQQFTLPGQTQSQTLSLPTGPFLELGIGTPGSPATITLLNAVTVSGVFFLEESTSQSQGKVVSLGFQDAAICLGGTLNPAGSACTTGTLVSVTAASGAVEITQAGVAGSISGTVSIGGPLATFFSINAPVSVVFNSGATAVSDSITYAPPGGGSATQAIAAPAGPLVAVQLGNSTTPASASFGSATITGIFEFQLISTSSGTTLEVGATDVSIPSLSLNGLQGALVYQSGAQAGIAGILEVPLSAGNGSTGISGQIGVQFNTTGAPINKSVTVDGTPISINVPALASPYFQAVALNVSINLGNLVEIYGDSFSLNPATHAFAGSGLTLFVGSGPYKTNDVVNPNAMGLLINNGAIQFQQTNSGYGLYATGTLALAGLSGLNITANITLEINNTGAPVTFSDCTTTVCSLDAATTFSLTAASVDINVANVLDISGTLSISRTANGTLTLAVGGPCSGPFNNTTGCTNSGCTPPACNDAALTVTVSGNQVFDLKGNASFTIDPVNGFHLQSYSLDDVSLLGFDICAVVPGGCPSSPAPTLPPSGSLATQPGAASASGVPVNGATVAAGPSTKTLYVTLSDPNGKFAQFTGSGQPIQILYNGQPFSGLTIGAPTHIAGTSTYSFAVTGFPTSPGLVSVEFVPGSIVECTAATGGTCNSSVANLATFQQFYLVAAAGSTPAPAAVLSSPAVGQPIAATALNAAGYIDVTYQGFGTPFSSATLAALAAATYSPFTLSGSGLGAGITLNGSNQAQLASVEEISSDTAQTTVTFRYTFAKGTGDLFQAGTVTVAFPTGATGQYSTQIITIQDPPMFTSSASVSLGPLTLQGPSFGLEDVGFDNGQLVLTIGIGLNQASFGLDGNSGAQSSSGVTANLTGILGTFQLKVDVLGLLSGKFHVDPGTFTLAVRTLAITVPDVVSVTAAGLKVTYDPHGASNQQLVSLDGASITFPKFPALSGTLCRYDTTAGAVAPVQGVAACGSTTPAAGHKVISGLTVFGDGFTLGYAAVTYNQPISLPGGILTLNDLTVDVTNFAVKFDSNPVVSGSITVSSTGATFLQGDPISGTITQAPGAAAGAPAIALTLTFTGAHVDDFKFSVPGQLTVTIGSFVTLTTTNFMLDTGAIGTSNTMISVASLGASVNIGSVQLTGTASNFAIDGNGHFSAGRNFGVSLSIGGADGGSFQWPSWMPISIQSIGISWPNITTDPGNFTLDLSAGINSISGLPGLQISGSVDNIQIDPALLAQGKFPIVGISGFAVTISGNLFGGELTAGLVGGILDLSAANTIVLPTDTTTPIAQRIPYFAIEGGFSFGGLAGFTIRVGLSSLGPLQAFIDVELPSGILLDPDTGLTINNFSAGIEFNQTVTDICNHGAPLTDPHQLSTCTMPSATAGTAAQWLATLQHQIVAQAASGTTWATAFSHPMLILGSADLYSIYTSQLLFNAKVSVAISTDGQILVEGQLNFADNQLSLGAYLYANLTQISSGGLTIMFLAQVPQQLQILVLYGELKMGFENDAGQPLVYNVTGGAVVSSNNPPSAPTASLAAPNSGQSLSQADLSGEGWVDVTYPSFGGSPVDVNSVINDPQPFLLTDAQNDHLTLVGKPVLIDPATNTFRYFFGGYTPPAIPTTDPGINLTWEGGWNNSAGASWCGPGMTSCTQNATADPTVVGNGGKPQLGSWIDVNLATPAGESVAVNGSLTTLPPASMVTLSGAGAGSLQPFGTTAVQVGPNTYRFLYTGSVGTGTVNVSFAAGAWQGAVVDSTGHITSTTPSIASTGSFNVVAPAQNFFIEISGGLDVYIPGLSQPALDVVADVKLTVDPVAKVVSLTFSGQLTVIYLGVLGYTAGSFTLDLGPSGPNLWGVATVSASYPGLAAEGLYLTASGTLEVNTSTQAKDVTLQLPTGPNGAEQAAPYHLQPTSLQIAVTGQAALRPPGTSTDLIDLTGGFYIGISPQGLQVYAVATLQIGGVQLGQATGLIMISTGINQPGIPGIAALLTVGGTASLGLPDAGSLITISGSATVMLNTTFADQTFQIPAQFVALQAPGDPTSITIYGAPPGLSGQPNPGAAPAVYASVAINAQITIGGVITLTGFVQIEVAAGSQGAMLTINGAVSANISFLGSLTGQINLTVFVLPTPGVVGRVVLTLNSSSIPGVKLNGQFMLEINTLGTAQTIQTYALYDTTGALCQDNGSGNPCSGPNQIPSGFKENAAGDPLTTTVTIPAGPYFALYMFGDLELLNLITVTGSVAFTLDLNGSNPGISLVVNGSVSLGPLGSLKLTDSGFSINSQGLVANLNLSIDGNLGGSLGLSISGSAVISLNTTGQTATLGSSQIQPGFFLAIQGSVTFAGFATASGAITVTIQSGVFQLTFDVQFAIGPLNFSAKGGAGIYTNGANDTGIALALNVSLSIDAAVFSINATGTLEINTTGTNHLGVPGDSFLLSLNGQISLLKVLNFNASITIAVSQTTLTQLQVGPVTIAQGTQTGGWYFEANADVSFFGIATLSGAIFLDANGDFTVSLNGGITIGSSDFGLSGNFSFLISSQHDTFGGYRLLLSGSANVSVNAFGISLAGIGVDFSVCASTSKTYQCPDGYTTGGASTPLNLDIHIHVHILFVTISGTAHFTLGYLQLPQPVYLGGSQGDIPAQTDGASGAQDWAPSGAQTLTLNVGSYQQQRNIATDGTSDMYEIAQTGGSATDATIQVTAFGRTETFTHVSQIVADWSGQPCSGGCQMMVDVGPSVTVPVHIIGGPGSNVINYEGNSSSTTLTGGTGTNIITDSSPANVTINDSNSGQAGTIDNSGTGTAHITSGNHGDTIFGGPSGNDVITGGGGNDVVFGPANTISLNGSNNQIIFNAGQGPAAINDQTGTTGNVLTIIGAAGGDTLSGTTLSGGFTTTTAGHTITVNSGIQELDFKGTSGTESFSSFNVNGNNGLSTLSLTAPGSMVLTSSNLGAPTLTLTSTSGSITVTGSTVSGSSSLTVTGATGVTVQRLGTTRSTLSGGSVVLTATSGSVSVSNSTVGGSAVTLTASSGPVAVSGSTLSTTAGDLTVSAPNGPVGISASTLSASGNVTLSGVGVTVNCTSAQNTVTCSSINGSGNLTVSSPAGPVLITGSTLTSGGALGVTAGPNAGTSPAESVTITGATLTGATSVSVTASGGITVNAGQSPSKLKVTHSGGSIGVTARGGSLLITDTTLDASPASGTIDLQATGGNVTLDTPTLTAGGDATVTATNASVSIQGGTLTTTGTGRIRVTGAQNVSIGGAALSAAGANTLQATTGAVSLNAATISGASIGATAGSSLTILSGSLSAPSGQITLTASGVNVLPAGSSTMHLTGTTVNGSTVTGNATGLLVIDGATSVLAGQDVGFTATVIDVVLKSALTATNGSVTLTATGGDLTLNDATLTAGNTVSGLTPGPGHTPTDDVVVESSRLLGGSQVSLDASAGSVSITGSTLCAGTTSATACSSATTGNVALIADGGSLTIDNSSVTSGGGITGRASGSLLSQNGTQLTANQGSVTLTANGGDVTLHGTPVSAGDSIFATASRNFTADTGATLTTINHSITLAADGGDLTLDTVIVSAGTSVTGTATQDVVVHDSRVTAGTNNASSPSGDTVSFTGGNNVTVDPSTVTAVGTVTLIATHEVLTLTGATVSGSAITGTAGTNLLMDRTSSLTAATITTLQGGWQNQPGSLITLLGTFISPLIEIYGGNGGDTFLLNPVAIVGYTQLRGGTGNDTITLQLPTIDLGNKFYPSMCPTQTSCPANALDNGTAVETALAGLSRTIQSQNRNFDGQALFPLRNMVDVNGGPGSDTYNINASGTTTHSSGTDYIINVHDSGSPTDFNTLNVNGPAQDSNFLLRQGFVALLSPDPNHPGSFLPDYERINYDNTLNLLHVIGGPDNNNFFVDDNSAITVLDGGGGVSNFQFGQLYGADRSVTYLASQGVQTLQPGDVVRSNGNDYEYTGQLPFTGDLSVINFATANSMLWALVPTSGVAAANDVAPGDEIVTVDTTVGWLSRGISYATTAYAGNQGSTFNVYSNHASLKLLGEGGNDTFVIRAFQLVTGNGTATSSTLVQGGSGINNIEYNVNAPVSIQGGRGYNSVVVVGTGTLDNFVITKDGVYGDGLFVQYTNVQKVEVDAGGGTANFWVLSTAPNVVTVLTGANGHSTFNVAGDVTGQIVALNPNGTSAAINHMVTSNDPSYNGIFAPGLPFSVANGNTGQVQLGVPSGGLTLLQPANGGAPAITSYTLSLGVTPPAPGAVWYVSVAAAPDFTAGAANCQPPNANTAACGQGLLLSADGGSTWSSDLVLTFDSSPTAAAANLWSRTQTILVEAPSGAVVGGDATAEIMQSVLSTVPVTPTLIGYDTIPVSNVDVHVIDGNLPGIVVSAPSDGLNVIEGGLTDTYTVSLTRAPAADEQVVVTLSSDDSRVRFSSTTLTFTSGGSQTVTVSAIDDHQVQGVRLSSIFATVTSEALGGGSAPADALYAHGVTDNPTVYVNVFDTDSGGVVVLPAGPSIVSPHNASSYTIQLTRAPVAASGTGPAYVDVSILTDGLTLVSSSDLTHFSLTGGVNGSPMVTFDASNWNVPITINVTANPTPPPAPTSGGGQPVQVFPNQPHMTDSIYGPLIIDGSTTAARPLVEGVGLPGELDAPLPPPPAPTLTGPAGTARMATLNIFDDGQPIGDLGTMSAVSATEFAALQTLYSGASAVGLDQSQFNEIKGLNMGGSLQQHPPGDPLLTFDGGIAYRNIDVVDVMLGNRATNVAGQGVFTVSSTLLNAITVVQGGGGYKKLIATGGGGYNSPLVLLGNTTQNGSFYNSIASNITGEALQYLKPGQSVLDASQDPNSVIIYGGVGDSQIYGGGGGDQIAGGSGADGIYAGSGNDIIYANDGFNLYLLQPLAQVVARNLSALIVTHDPSPSDAPTGDPLNSTSDQIYGGIGHDIVFLDHGNVDQLSNPITGTEGVLDAYTTDPTAFGASAYFGAFNGTSIVLAGTGQQTIDVSHTTMPNVVVKNGYVYFSSPDGWIAKLAKVGSSDPGAGGNDKITLGNGNDVVVAGTGYDKITGGDGNKIVLADDGEITWVAGLLTRIISQDPGVSQNSTSGNTITLGNGNDVVFGGSGRNTITLGNGNDVVAGALGDLNFDKTGTPTTFQSVYPTIGGPDTIKLGSGGGVVIGGPGSSSVSAGPAYTVVPAAGPAYYLSAERSWSLTNGPPAAPVVTTTAPPQVLTTAPVSLPITLVIASGAGKTTKTSKKKKPKKKTQEEDEEEGEEEDQEEDQDPPAETQDPRAQGMRL